MSEKELLEKRSIVDLLHHTFSSPSFHLHMNYEKLVQFNKVIVGVSPSRFLVNEQLSHLRILRCDSDPIRKNLLRLKIVFWNLISNIVNENSDFFDDALLAKVNIVK